MLKEQSKSGGLYFISSKMIEESVLIWMVVKDAAPDIIKAGGNPIEVKT